METLTSAHTLTRRPPPPAFRSATTAILRRPLLWRNVAFAAGAAVVPTAIGLAVGQRSRVGGALAGGLAAMAFAGLRWQLARWFRLEPPYTVEQRIGPLEVRAYPPRVEARTRIEGVSFEDAMAEGAHRLAEYIVGNNRRAEALDMTEPVIARGEPTELTSPVITSDEAGAFTMAFVMPPGRTRSTLPRPHDPRVELVQVPGRRVVAMRFHGDHSASRVAAYQRDLVNLVAGAGFTARGAPSFAGYDPRTTLPLLRRNEVLIEIA